MDSSSTVNPTILTPVKNTIGQCFLLTGLVASGQLIIKPKWSAWRRKAGCIFHCVWDTSRISRGLSGWLAQKFPRYDGYRFLTRSHSPNDSTTLYENYINGMTLDPEGNIWLAHPHGKFQFWIGNLTVRRIKVKSRWCPDRYILFRHQKRRCGYILPVKVFTSTYSKTGDKFTLGITPEHAQGSSPSEIRSVYQGINCHSGGWTIIKSGWVPTTGCTGWTVRRTGK